MKRVTGAADLQATAMAYGEALFLIGENTMENKEMTLRELLAKDTNPQAAEIGWTDWDEVEAETIDKAFDRELADMALDAKTIKIMLMESMGVTAANIGEYAKTGEIKA